MYKRTRINSLVIVSMEIVFYVFLFIIGNASNAQTSGATFSREIKATPRPLADAVDRLQLLSIKPVITYEDPILAWKGDVESKPQGNGFLPKRHAFILPSVTTGNKPNAQLLGEVISAYQAADDGPRFKVVASSWGLHIVPDLVRDQGGQYVKTGSLLDTYISVPLEARTPSEHLNAICEAVTVSSGTGIRLEPFSPWLDQYYAPNGIRPPRVITNKDKTEISFSWGVSQTTAREAVINLLERSSTTLTWKLLCEPGEAYCVFNLLPVNHVVVGSDGKSHIEALLDDRCTKCPSK